MCVVVIVSQSKVHLRIVTLLLLRLTEVYVQNFFLLLKCFITLVRKYFGLDEITIMYKILVKSLYVMYVFSIFDN